MAENFSFGKLKDVAGPRLELMGHCRNVEASRAVNFFKRQE